MTNDKDAMTSKIRDFERMLAQQFKDVADLEHNNKE